MECRKGNTNDIPEVLELQSKNLYGNLNEAQRQKGFVTTPFTTKQIQDIILEDGLFVAEDDNTIIAYVYAGSWSYFKQWEIFNVMIQRFPLLDFKGQSISVNNTFQYGPICIAEPYRGKGLINQIFETMRLNFVNLYPISLTFINQANTISEAAHVKKLGWEIIDSFSYNNNTYITLALDMHISVL